LAGEIIGRDLLEKRGSSEKGGEETASPTDQEILGKGRVPISALERGGKGRRGGEEGRPYAVFIGRPYHYEWKAKGGGRGRSGNWREGRVKPNKGKSSSKLFESRQRRNSEVVAP